MHSFECKKDSVFDMVSLVLGTTFEKLITENTL